MNSSIIAPVKILKASAGSGKTFALTVQFLGLLFSGENKYRKIMAVTFTNKATAEMKERILSVLKDFAEEKKEETKEYLTAILKEYPTLTETVIYEKASVIYRQILHDYSSLTITTIDKFVQQIIRSFTFELGIEPGYEITLNLTLVAKDLAELLHFSLDENKDLRERIISNAIQKINDGEKWNYQEDLEHNAKIIFSEEFQNFDIDFNENVEDPIALFDTIQERIKKTIDDFEDHLKKLIEEGRDILEHSPSAVNLKGKSGAPINFLKKDINVTIDDLIKKGTHRIEKLIDNIEEWFKKSTAEDFELYHSLNPLVKEFLTHYHTHLANYIFARNLNKNLFQLRLIVEMSRLLKDYRVSEHILLISDASHLLKGITQGMEDNPSFIWEKTGNRYQHFLFDEFQDTSRNQWNNFLPLVKNALGTSTGKQHEHLIVGDVKQSIYRFRGGDWNILLNQAENDLGKHFVDIQSLQTNYRSDAQIIEFNNQVFPAVADWVQNHLNKGVEEEEGIDFYQSFWQKNNYHTIIKQAYADVQQEIPEHKKNPKTGIVDWKIFEVENNKHRGSKIKENVHQFVADNLYRWIVEEKKYTAGQIGILVRKKDEAVGLQSFLEKDLENKGMANAYQIISGETLSLNEHPAIKLLISTFRLLVQKVKNQKLYQAECAYFFHLYQNRETDLSIQEWMNLGNKQLEKLDELLPSKIIKESEHLKQLPLSELTEELIIAYELGQQKHALPYLFAFRDYIASYSSHNQADINNFLEWWDNEELIPLPSNEDVNAIRIMTVHKAKGLAFDVLLLPFLVWEFNAKSNSTFWIDSTNTTFSELKNLPINYKNELSQSSIKEAYYKEKLEAHMDAFNLLYVAMTRPKKHIVLCIPGRGSGVIKRDSYLVGDALFDILNEYKTEHGEALIYPEKANEIVEIKKEKTHEGWHFQNYPFAHHLKKQLDKTTKNKAQRIDNEEHIRIGTSVHELLSLCSKKEEIDLQLNRLFQEGWFSEKEKGNIKKTALSVFENKALQELLDQNNSEFLNEKEIINAQGKSFRPDKVLLKENETIILDYKFGKESEQHHTQVEEYKSLFKEMGYPNVKGYLFYGFQGKLIEV